ncbi:MAG TPA: O-antigen ligase family protein [Acidimicrobiales bacterium]|nr:O-antigen ligase family protein [Acidimicrobiales bacterium]
MQRRPAPRPKAQGPSQPRPPLLPSWPAWVWVWLAATAFFFILRAGGAIQSIPLCVFLSAIAGALSFGLDQLRAVGPAQPLLRLRQIVLVGLLVAMPSLFDPTTIDIDNLPRLVLLVVASVLLLGIWAVDAVWGGWRPRRLVNGFQWVLLGTVVWFAVTTLTSAEPRISFIGRQGSYEGFILVASLAVLASAMAESFSSESLPALFRMIVASTVPVLVYGAIQIYGFDVHKGSSLDFVPWHVPFHNVFASMGNPNHLGGYFVTVLPLGIVAAVLTKSRWQRIVLWVWVALTIVLLLQTAARGAWLGGLAGGAILVVGLLPRLRAGARTVGIAAGGGLVVAVALIAGGSRFLGAKASALLQFGSGSSVSQRYGYWSSAFRLAVHHPLVGTGPDTFAATYTRYQDATLAKELGSGFFVNGAHNVFLSWMANEGFPGLVLMFALFVFGLAWGIRAWMSARAGADDEAAPDQSAPLMNDARRYLVAALVAAFVGYFVQASFDVEQVETLFILFIVLGMLGIVNRGAWPVHRLVGSPFGSRGVRPEPGIEKAERDSAYSPLESRPRSYGRSSRQAQQQLRRLALALTAGALGITALGVTFWRADAIWRADHQAWLGSQTSITKATQLNPWEPSYFLTLGQAALDAYSRSPHSSDALAIVQAGVGFLRQSAALDGANSLAQEAYGGALMDQAKLEPSNKSLLRDALAALRLAKQENPFNTNVDPMIAAAETALASH